MAIKPICDFCKKELGAFGGILFGPLDKNNNVRKFHVCVNCYKKFLKMVGKY